jgi:methionyl-tRNA formyltransferase
VDDVACELRHVGKIIFISDGKPTIICGSGLLRILEAFDINTNEEVDYLPMKSFRVRFV